MEVVDTMFGHLHPMEFDYGKETIVVNNGNQLSLSFCDLCGGNDTRSYVNFLEEKVKILEEIVKTSSLIAEVNQTLLSRPNVSSCNSSVLSKTSIQRCEMGTQTDQNPNIIHDGICSIPSVPSSEVASEAQGTQEDKTAYSAISSVPLVSETEPFDLNSCIQISEGAPFSSFSVETIVNETMFTHTFRNRKAAYYGDYPYSYNGGSHKACDVSNGSHLSKLLSYVSVVYPSLNYNSVMVQLYDTGIDYMPAHSDNESCIAIGSDIVTISLGASRTLVLRDAENGDYIGQCTLDHGNVYVMSQETQNLVTHEIAQDPECFQKRISITLRLISPPTPSDTIISRPDLLTNPKNQQRAPVTSEPTPAHVKTPVSQKSALFISSSMFRFLDCQKLSSQALKANKFFYPGANATVMLNKLKKDLSGIDISPSVIYVMCGTNNVDSVYYGSQSLSEAVGDITKVIRYLKTVFPSSMVNFVNILPRYKLGRNDVVREINLNVKKFCLEQMINVMETEHLFNFKNGLRRNEFFAPPSAHISDNCHLNRSGVTKLGRHLKYWAHKHIS
ncbi:hypothetical protein ACHWQZ_G004336 [Mnemiopsis leidyi]